MTALVKHLYYLSYGFLLKVSRMLWTRNASLAPADVKV